ncbi:PREDICTED: uncharacterized protein LOC107169932 [Diuraphis noxia]|uniref:uncharacterized protein LOC107169932 n=1 Tax=Diuraphis noxia TaxID=143948 RepID=UPI0007636FCC|nr:PREDICTED: uncharacterized protein LOC107169932 [Diuraphis noxia]
MIKFKGKLGIKQYMKSKPCPWGIKNFLLCSSKGMIYAMVCFYTKENQLKLTQIFLKSDKDLTKLGRGSSYEVSSKDNKIGIIKWCDNKIVYLGSNYVTSGTPDIVKRFDKKEKRYIEMSRPEIVRHNNSMGDVDLHHQLISYLLQSFY